MFTGIVKNQGIVAAIRKKGQQIRMAIRFKKKETNLRLGESITVNGVCLTVTEIGSRSFTVDIVNATLKSTTLGFLRTGSPVNLERSLKLGDSISGHFVTGHVDGQGIVEKILKQGRNRLLWIRSPKEIVRFLASKGSVAVDGISLTIQEVSRNSFKIALIPYTSSETTLGIKKIGDAVNLEIDLITRYLKVIMQNLPPASLSRHRLKPSQLKKEGF